MSDVERIEVEIYGTESNGSYLGRLETYVIGVPIVTDRERALQHAPSGLRTQPPTPADTRGDSK